jgi:transcriptional regulator with XRE-family HTH domain
MADEQLYMKRQGFALRMARERAGKSQGGVAEFLGYSKNSKSSVSDYENGVTPVPILVLRRLAAWYGVPLRVFTEPDLTVEERLDEIVRLATDEERADWEAGEGQGPKADAAPGGARRRRSA